MPQYRTTFSFTHVLFIVVGGKSIPVGEVASVRRIPKVGWRGDVLSWRYDATLNRFDEKHPSNFRRNVTLLRGPVLVKRRKGTETYHKH